jgi:hypothetical protein
VTFGKRCITKVSRVGGRMDALKYVGELGVAYGSGEKGSPVYGEKGAQ